MHFFHAASLTSIPSRRISCIFLKRPEMLALQASPLLLPPPRISTSIPPLKSMSSSSFSSFSASGRRKFPRLSATHTPPLSSISATQTMNITGDHEEAMVEPPKRPERDYANTPYVPVYVMLPLGMVNAECELTDPEWLRQQLMILKGVNVDGVMVDCWWGIVEKSEPRQYNWEGYKKLFKMIRELNLKLQVVMSFHACGGNAGDDIHIPLPEWIREIGCNNLDIYFTDRQGWRNPECLSWGIDKQRVLKGRTAAEVYYEYMRSFREEFNEFIGDGVITGIGVGLGPDGELRYPSYPESSFYPDGGGWAYPGIGEFQCYDKYLMLSLKNAAEAIGQPHWVVPPQTTGSYKLMPDDTEFFCDGGEYDRAHGRFFLRWYSQVLIDHGDLILYLARLVFEDTCIAAKIPCIHWHYKSASHAAELAAGFYNPRNRDGYGSIVSMLKKHNATLNFTCVEMRTSEQPEDARSDPEGLVWQVLNDAWDARILVASENALPCYARDSYNQILENAKPHDEPYERRISAFTYLRLAPTLMEDHPDGLGGNFYEFVRFVKRMHGEAVHDLEV